MAKYPHAHVPTQPCPDLPTNQPYSVPPLCMMSSLPFLDHAIRCGDSLLGVDLRQLSTWSLSGEGRQSVLFDDDLSFAADKREGLMKMQYHPGDQRRLLDAALAKTRRLRGAGL